MHPPGYIRITINFIFFPSVFLFYYTLLFLSLVLQRDDRTFYLPHRLSVPTSIGGLRSFQFLSLRGDLGGLSYAETTTELKIESLWWSMKTWDLDVLLFKHNKKRYFKHHYFIVILWYIYIKINVCKRTKRLSKIRLFSR